MIDSGKKCRYVSTSHPKLQTKELINTFILIDEIPAKGKSNNTTDRMRR
jgi:hypothetical protein